MEKRVNYRIYPNKEQETQIQKNFGCCRFVYNFFLNAHIEQHKAGEKFRSYYDDSAELTKLKQQDEYRWLYDADCNSLQAVLKELNNAYRDFFKRAHRGGQAPGFPKFKSKKNSRQSYTSKVTGKPAGWSKPIEVGNNSIKLPKLGWVKCSVSKQIDGRVISASICQTASGKYYVSVCVTDFEPTPLPKSGKSVGLHFGITHLVTTSEGDMTDNPRFGEKSAKKIAKLQRTLARKTSGSKNFEKARIKLARAYERVTNQKTDYLHKLSTQIVHDYDVICVSDKDYTKALQSPGFSKLISDAGWGELRLYLDYKCLWYGKELVKVDFKTPFSRMCSKCGFEEPEISKKNYIRDWTCTKCGEKHIREINSAINIRNAGSRLQHQSTQEIFTVRMDDPELNVCGGRVNRLAVTLGEAKIPETGTSTGFL